MTTIPVALIQLNSTSDKAASLARVHYWVETAFKQGAKWVVLPEMFHARGGDTFQNAEPLSGPTLKGLMSIASAYKGWIFAGSMAQLSETEPKVYNTCTVISPEGKLVASYQKMHLFDVDVTVPPLKESDTYSAGTEPVWVDVDGVRVGLSICYDLRFPELYQFYMKNGVDVVIVPASFTTLTGEAHWEVLLRARAIETQCFVLAPNQFGKGAGGVMTYGHSMAVDPWGVIMAQAGPEHEACLRVDLDLAQLKRIRTQMPLSQHKRWLA